MSSIYLGNSLLICFCRYKEINVRLKRLLAEERKSLQQLRQNYAQELKSRTELELLLRQSVDDVRKEIAKKLVLFFSFFFFFFLP